MMRMMDRILEIIDRSRTFLISSHERLDGDAVGSELALYNLFRQMGKEADVYNQDATPENYRFLPGSQVIRQDLPADCIPRYDVAFIVDCSDLSRVGRGSEQIPALEHSSISITTSPIRCSPSFPMLIPGRAQRAN